MNEKLTLNSIVSVKHGSEYGYDGDHGVIVEVKENALMADGKVEPLLYRVEFLDVDGDVDGDEWFFPDQLILLDE